RATGELGAANGAITLDVQAPQLDAFWPDVPGGADVRARIDGTVAAHRGEINASYTPPRPRPGIIGQSRAQANLTFNGGWGRGPAGQP
ncbi:hypothetical protein LLE87_34230, partial [Paenibacillus polymyxa]|nr:hypothetical protein [Paenibacillus polymyxa]